MTTYETTSLPAIDILQYTAATDNQSDVPMIVGPLFGRLLETIGGAGGNPDQPTIAWYGGIGDVTNLGVGVPAEGIPAATRQQTDLAPGELPAAPRAVVTRYIGSLDGVGPAWRALHQYLAEQELAPSAACREIYLEGSIDRPDSWVIELQQPVA